jgi:hypothetical protein
MFGVYKYVRGNLLAKNALQLEEVSRLLLQYFFVKKGRYPLEFSYGYNGSNTWAPIYS